MTRREFIEELNALLADLPDKDRLDILSDYTEHFLIGIEKGKSEHEITEQLGSPKTVAREVWAGYRIHQAQTDASIGNISRAILATVSLGFFNIVFVLGPFMALIGVLIAFYSVAVTLLFVPFAFAFFPPLLADISENRLLMLFGCLTSVGLGGMLFIWLLRLTVWLYRQFLRYLQFNVQMIRGK